MNVKHGWIHRGLAALAALTLCLGLSACKQYDKPQNTDAEEFYLAKNDQMDEETKAELDKITNAFDAYLQSGDPAGILEYIDKDFAVTQAQLRNFVEKYQSQKVNPFTTYDSYYIKDIEPDTVTKKIKKSADAETAVEVTPGSSEMYLVLYASENEKISQMISLLCAKMDNAWKIVWIDASDFKYRGEDAPALYQKGKELKEKGQNMPTYLYAEMLNLVMRPGNALTYKDAELMQDFYYQMSSEIKAEAGFPFTPEGMAATVQIHSVALTSEEQGIVPLIIMQTATPISDTAAVRAEAETAKTALGKKFAGLLENFDYFAFNVTNEDPTKTEKTPDVESFVLAAQ